VKILSGVNVGRVIYTHFNHTNPVLDNRQPYKAIVKAAGQENAFDGMKIRV